MSRQCIHLILKSILIAILNENKQNKVLIFVNTSFQFKSCAPNWTIKLYCMHSVERWMETIIARNRDLTKTVKGSVCTVHLGINFLRSFPNKQFIGKTFFCSFDFLN